MSVISGGRGRGIECLRPAWERSRRERDEGQVEGRGAVEKGDAELEVLVNNPSTPSPQLYFGD